MRIFDLLVLAALFVPIALIVAGNLAAYRSPTGGEGIFGADEGLTRLATQPGEEPEAAVALEDPAEVAELRRAA